MLLRIIALITYVLSVFVSNAARSEIPVDANFSYAPRFVCGIVIEHMQEGLVAGDYATHIVIVNPSDTAIRFQKFAIGALPFQRGMTPGTLQSDVVPPASTIAIECNEIRTMLPGSMSQEFRSGVLEIDAEASLDVDVTYSARPRGGDVSSIDQEAVPARTRACPTGMGGPDCTIECQGASTCGVDLFYNANGTVNGVIARGTVLTTTLNSADEAAVLADYRDWVRGHASLLGLAPMGGEPLDHIQPSGRPATQDGALTTHRFTQTYRGFPVAGPEEIISVTAGDFRGVLSVAGTVLDLRTDYAGLDNPLPEALAQQSMLDWFLDLSGISAMPSVIGFDNFQFVAVPQRSTMGFSADVTVGGFGAGSILVSAAVNDGGRAPLLSFTGLREHPEDETSALIRAENAADADDYARFGEVVDEFITDELVSVPPIAGEPFLGSVYEPDACAGDPALPECGQIRLGNRSVIRRSSHRCSTQPVSSPPLKARQVLAFKTNISNC